MEGVVFSRGQVVPVINLRARFGFDRAAINQRTRLLVVQQGTRQRRAAGRRSDASSSRSPTRRFIRRTRRSANLSGSYLDGVATLGERIVLILDVREVVESTPIAAA